jgi:hypothetical protein
MPYCQSAKKGAPRTEAAFVAQNGRPSVLGLWCAEEQMGHPYLSPLDVGRRTERLALQQHFVERVEVLVIDFIVVVVEVDHPVSGLSSHLPPTFHAP